MAKPKWDAAGDDLDLATEGYHVHPGSPQPRITQHSVTGISGAFVGLHGVGPRYWYGRGILSTADKAVTAAGACEDVKEALIARQEAVGTEIKSYTDTDGTVYTNCVLLSYQPAGNIVPFLAAAETAKYNARCAVTFTIMQQDPS